MFYFEDLSEFKAVWAPGTRWVWYPGFVPVGLGVICRVQSLDSPLSQQSPPLSF